MTPEQVASKREELLAERKALLGEELQTKLEKKRVVERNLVEYFRPYDPDKDGEVDPDKTMFPPRQNPKQAAVIEAIDNDRYKVFTYTGGNRIGKSTLWAAIVPCFSAGKWLWNNEMINFHHGQPRKIRIVGQDWENHVAKVVIPALKKWWPANRPVDTRKNNHGVEAYWVDRKTRSTVEIMSNRQEDDVFEGWDGDLVVYDEPPRRGVRVANARGLIDRNGRELFAMTLLKEAWVDREVIKARNDDGSPDLSVFNVNADIYSNVGFGITQSGVEEFIKKINDDERQARIHGKPAYMSGLVYPQFSRNLHLRRRFDLPLDWVVDIAIDIHPREKQAVLFLATDPRNERYVIDEIWEHGDGTWVGEEIVRRVVRNAYRVGQVIIDPLAKGDRNNPNTVYDKIEAVLWSHQMDLDVATKDKSAGILEVKSHLMGPNGQPSLWIFDDCKRTVEEIEGYMYKDSVPMDKDDHMMENLYRLCLLNTRWSPVKGSVLTETDDKVSGWMVA